MYIYIYIYIYMYIYIYIHIHIHIYVLPEITAITQMIKLMIAIAMSVSNHTALKKP